MFGLLFLNYLINFVKFEVCRSVFKIIQSQKTVNKILNNLDEGVIAMGNNKIEFKNNKGTLIIDQINNEISRTEVEVDKNE